MPYKPYCSDAATGEKALSKSEVVSTTSATASALGKKSDSRKRQDSLQKQRRGR
jgi:hypothetical protein